MAKLDEYQKKRDFRRTSEPPPGKRKLLSSHPIYVIQKHHARRLHFDFRLEEGGVLKSWAVPKGPSDNPSDKRLAVMTEDHPLDYANFSGMIPEGEYGAGKVEIWDRGHYVNITVKNGKVQPLDAAIKKGHFIIYVKGKRLEGTYGFTKMEGKNWILVKKREEKIYPKQQTEMINGKKVELTNLDKELDKGIRKGDLIEYYRTIAPLMLPHVKNRLLSMFRFPDGVGGEKFFQKNRPDYFPPWLSCKTVEHKGHSVCYPVITNEAGIVYVANQVAVPHIPVALVDRIDQPDKIVFDLDPSDTDLKTLKDVARRMRTFLTEVGFTPYIMATGGKGYHIVVPIKRELDNSKVRDFAFKIATVLANSDPRTLTTELRKEKRGGRIFLDVNRNSSQQTSVAPYAARASPGLPVAAPFDWDDLPNIDPQSYTITNPPKEDAWKDFFRHAVSVKKVIKKLT